MKRQNEGARLTKIESLSPLSTTVSSFYGKPVAKFLTISIQNANLARAEARTALRVINCLLLT